MHQQMVTAVARRTAGQLFMVGLPGPALDPGTEAFLREYTPGGVVLFRRNARTAAQIRRLTTAVHAIGAGPRTLLAIDHEGGRVDRLPRPFTHFPAAAQVAASGGPQVAREVGRAMGRELSAVGIDVDFAPVLDVASNPRNQVIGDRAFGTTAGAVARCGIAFARGLRDVGVVPCGKHFPGHGDTTGDSHHVLPRDRRSRHELLAGNLPPFERAIRARIPALMTSHVVYPALDTRPATLSRAICHDLLRRRFGFTGVLFSDDLEMQAVARHRQPERTVVAALAAGCDMLLVCKSLDLAARCIEAVARALTRGRLVPRDAMRSLARIERLRQLAVPAPPDARLTWPRHAALARRLARSA
jgi:beta-N-acetylhexosaminidase